MAQNKGIFFLIFLVIEQSTSVAALKCYTCASNIGDIDQRCVTNASAVESGQITTNCNNQYCTSKRVEYKDPVNTVQSMKRGCVNDPGKLNAIVEDSTFITYYKTCGYDLCNDGDGKASDSSGGSIISEEIDGVILVEGTGISTKNIALIANVLAGIIAILMF